MNNMYDRYRAEDAESKAAHLLDVLRRIEVLARVNESCVGCETIAKVAKREIEDEE